MSEENLLQFQVSVKALQFRDLNAVYYFSLCSAFHYLIESYTWHRYFHLDRETTKNLIKILKIFVENEVLSYAGALDIALAIEQYETNEQVLEIMYKFVDWIITLP